jgi:group I intron endonuclease
MSRGIIYLITNKENGHKYVGQTTQGMNKRWQQHIQEALRMSDNPIHRAMRKYGNHNFRIQEIDECDGKLLNEREEYWIKHYNTFESAEGYNATSGGDNFILSEETKEKISKKASQRIFTQTHTENISTSLSIKAKKEPWGIITDKNRGDGKHCGLQIRGKNLETGICIDYENARMAALSLTGDPNKNSNILLAARKGGTAYGHKWQLLEDKQKKKAVFAVNKKTGEIYDRYESIADAARSLSGPGKGTGIIKSLRNPGRYSWKGYYWFYVK